MNQMIEFLLKCKAAHINATCTGRIPSTISLKKIEERGNNHLCQLSLIRLIQSAEDLKHTFDDDMDPVQVLRETIAHSLERTCLYEYESERITLSLIV